MNFHQRNETIARNEHKALNDYLDAMEGADQCSVPLCHREAYIEYKGDVYCRHCYEDLLFREDMDNLD